MASDTNKIEVTISKAVKLSAPREVLSAALAIARAATVIDPAIRETAVQLAGVMSWANLDLIESEIKKADGN